MLSLKNKNSSAVIVIDIQNDFCHPEGVLGKKGLDLTQITEMVPRLIHFIHEAKSLGLPIIYVKTIHYEHTNTEVWTSRKVSSGVAKPNTWGANFYKINPGKDSIIVEKHRYSAFYQTDLDIILQSLNIKEIFITGVNTEVCIDTTAREGFMRNYRTNVLSDLVATVTPGVQELTLKTLNNYFGDVLTSKTVLDRLK